MKKIKLSICILTVLFAAKVSDAQITGTVYRDYNGNGTRETTTPTNEPGVPGVVVTAYDASDAVVATTSTANNGTYSILFTVPVRLEFSFPSGSECVGSSEDNSTFGSGGSNVRFVGAPGTVDYGVQYKADFITSTNPFVFTNTWVNGDPTGGGTAGTQRWFIGYPYNNTGLTAPTFTLNGTSIGTTWGIAYSKQAGKLFTSAFVKRHCGLGTLGAGGIYLLTPSSNTFTVTSFFDMDANSSLLLGSGRTRAASTAPAYGAGTSYQLSTNGYSVTYLGATDPASGQPEGLGVVGTNTDRGLPSGNTANYDPAAFDQVGKVGLGDMEISDDGRFLFVVNLYDRKLYRLQLNNAYNPTSVTSIESYSLPSVTVSNGVLRPFGIKFYRDKVFVGALTTAENGGTNTVGGTTDMNAYVFVLNQATGAAVFQSSAVISFPLNYRKGASRSDQTGVNRGEKWNPWTNNSRAYLPQDNNFGTYPTPIFSGLEFTERGDLIMGFMDRSGNQWGWANRRNLSTTTSNVNYIIGGDLLIAGRNCGTGALTLEGNGSYSSLGQTYSSAGGGVGNNQGPGGGEFFDQEFIASNHAETQMGAMVRLPGSDQVLTAIMDPKVINSGGTIKFSTVNGAKSDDYQIYGTANGAFSKANGLGDIELASAEIPLEIGNRVWNDQNNNGIQDAGENGIANVSIEFYSNGTDGIPGNADDVLLGSTTTNSLGEWYFNHTNVTDGDPFTAGNQSGPQPGLLYNVRVGSSDWSGGLGVNDLAGLGLVSANVVGSGIVDYSDNDAALSGSVPLIPISLVAFGDNNHNLDFGFSAAAALPLQSMVLKGHFQRQIMLSWTTQDEFDVHSFEIERSVDGRLFELAGTVTGKGNGSHLYRFSEVPVSSVSGTVYYRIKAVSLNGAVQFSNTVAIQLQQSITFNIVMNQISGKPFGLVTLPKQEKGVIRIFSQNGQMVNRVTKIFQSGINQISLDDCLLPNNNFYFVELQLEHFRQTRKLYLPQ